MFLTDVAYCVRVYIGPKKMELSDMPSKLADLDISLVQIAVITA